MALGYHSIADANRHAGNFLSSFSAFLNQSERIICDQFGSDSEHRKVTSFYRDRRAVTVDDDIFALPRGCCLSALNYLFYDHRLTALEEHSRATAISNSVNEPLSTLTSLSNDEKNAVREPIEKYGHTWSYTIAAGVFIGFLILLSAGKGIRPGG